jgi:hypothetical protein
MRTNTGCVLLGGIVRSGNWASHVFWAEQGRCFLAIYIESCILILESLV